MEDVTSFVWLLSVDDSAIVQDLDEVIRQAKEAGLQAAVVVPEFYSEFPRVLQLADHYPDFILPCLGLHPVQQNVSGVARSVCTKDLDEAEAFIHENHERIGAIGEVGLDFTPYHCKEEVHKSEQREVFRRQIEIAKKYDLAVNVHSRSAGRPTIAWLKQHGAEKVLLHAFDGKVSVAMEGVQAGYYFSIPPSVIRSEQKQKLLQTIPLDNILLETDSPALGPEKQIHSIIVNAKITDPIQCYLYALNDCFYAFTKGQR